MGQVDMITVIKEKMEVTEKMRILEKKNGVVLGQAKGVRGDLEETE